MSAPRHSNSDANRQDLLKETFNPATGTLHDPKDWQSEREGIFKFLDGAFLSFRNPPAHKFIDTDAEEAFDLIVLANRILLVIEERQQHLQPQLTRSQRQPTTSDSSYEGLLSYVDAFGTVHED